MKVERKIVSASVTMQRTYAQMMAANGLVPIPKSTYTGYQRYEEAVDFNVYRLMRTFSSYDSYTARNVQRDEKQMLHMIKQHRFNRQDPVILIGFLSDFRDACETNYVK